MRYTQITIDVATFEELWQAKDSFRKLVGGKVTWSNFIEQAILFLEAQRLLPEVKAARYNPYVYGAECPNCGTEKYPLRRRGRIIWKIGCKKCGLEYIAIA